DPRNRERLEVLDGGRLLLHEAAERRILALEGPGDESGEAAGLLLQIPHEFEMIHALLDRLAAAEHHRRGRAHAELVRRPMDVDPLLHGALQPADAMPHRVVEDFGAAARNRIES